MARRRLRLPWGPVRSASPRSVGGVAAPATGSFRILAEKKKCISCNVCTSVCHQGINIMNVADKGLPMQDPECVRCSACVQSCPIGVLWFGQVDRRSGHEFRSDPPWLAASPVRRRELPVRPA